MNISSRLSGHLGLRTPEGALLRHQVTETSAAAGVAALAHAGFGGVFDNYLSIRPPEWVTELGSAASEHGLTVTSFVYDCENWNQPGWIDGTALKALPRMTELARRTGAQVATCPFGPESEVARDAQMRRLAANLRRAAETAYPTGLTLGVEACHPDFAPGQFLRNFDEALALVQRADHPGVRLTLDVGHISLLGGDPVAAIGRAARYLGNVQFADTPGRVEPGAGTLDWAAISAALVRASFTGPIEIECEPATAGAAGEQAMLERLAALPLD